VSSDKEPILLEAVTTLSRCGIQHWACCGTLLGIVRDGALIPWDPDVDLGVFFDDKNRLIEIFRALDYDLLDDGWHSDYVTFGKAGIKLDINIFRQYGDSCASLWRHTRLDYFSRALGFFLGRPLSRFRFPGKRLLGRLIYGLKGYSYQPNLLADFVSLSYRGYEVVVPSRYEEMLLVTYGEHWRTPRRDYVWDREAGNVMAR
jgi:hypothetical protein